MIQDALQLAQLRLDDFNIEEVHQLFLILTKIQISLGLSRDLKGE